MKHLKLFENNTETIIYLCVITQKNGTGDTYSFYDKLSRNNFTINHICNEYKDNDIDYEIEDIFDIDTLIENFNVCDLDKKIYLDTAKVLNDVKLDPEIQIKYDIKKFNL